MYNFTLIDTTTARKNFSKIIENVFLRNESYVITKRNIPLVKIVKVEDNKYFVKEKEIDLSLFGVFKRKKTSAVDIARQLRQKNWVRRKI